MGVLLLKVERYAATEDNRGLKVVAERLPVV